MNFSNKYLRLYKIITTNPSNKEKRADDKNFLRGNFPIFVNNGRVPSVQSKLSACADF